MDWSEYEPRNRTFLNLGLPPVIQHRYREKYASFWNERLPEELRNVKNMNPSPPYSEFYGPSNVPSETPSPVAPIPQRGSFSSSRDTFIDGKINLFPNSGPRPRPTDDPYKLLQLMGARNPSRHNVMAHPDATEGEEEVSGREDASTTERIIIVNPDIVEKADVTLYALIFMVVLLVLILTAFAVVLRRAHRNKGDANNPRHDTASSNATTTTDKMACSDVDESYVISTMMRNKKKPPPTDKYESVSFCRSLLQKYQRRRRVKNQVFNQSNKVAEWMTSEELAKYSPQFYESKLTLNRHSSFLGNGSTGTMMPAEKVSVAIDATPQNRSDSVLRQEPIEITKAKANYLHNNNDRIIICQEIDDMPDMQNRSSYGSNHSGGSYSSSDMSNCSDAGCGGGGTSGGPHQDQEQSINPLHGAAYEQMMETSLGDDEQVTSFITEHEDINVTCRDESVERDPLTPTETLSNIQRRKFPKVLPDHPDKNKRHSLPSTASLSFVPVAIDVHQTPSRVVMNTATLGRRGSNHSRYRPASRIMGTSEIQMAHEPPPQHEEPQITSNTLIVGPLVKRSAESIYTTLKKSNEGAVNHKRKMMPLPGAAGSTSNSSSADSIETVKRVQL